jgi:hypothetical protein
MKGKCLKCVRYHPKAVGNCRKAQSVRNLEKRHKVNLSVTKCNEYLAPELVFTIPVTMGCTCESFYKYGICECEGEG